MGVGYFTKVSEKRTKSLQYGPPHSTPRGPTPRWPTRSVAPTSCSSQWPHRMLPEVGFSNDHRHFVLSGWGLALLMGMCAVACAAACGSAQACKLMVQPTACGRRTWYVCKAHCPPRSPLHQLVEGFRLTRVLLVMGDQPREQLANAEANLGKVRRTLGALWPASLLVPRVVLAFVVSTLHYVYEAMPPHPWLRKVQEALDRGLARALQAPRNVPCALSWTPPDHGGLGVPHLYTRSTSTGASTPWTPGA